jgi:hypothetical protein
LALGEFQSATEQLEVASLQENDPATHLLKAAAYGRLASGTSDPNVKITYQEAALNSYSLANKAASGKESQVYTFVTSDPELRTLLEEKGVELTNPSSRR